MNKEDIKELLIDGRKYLPSRAADEESRQVNLLFDFIQKEISLAVAEERGRMIKKINSMSFKVSDGLATNINKIKSELEKK